MKDSKFFTGHDVRQTLDQGTPNSVFLSVLQGFGPKLKKEQTVNLVCPPERASERIANEKSGQVSQPETTVPPPPRPYRQIVVVLKELGPSTYKCLQRRPNDEDEVMENVSSPTSEGEEDLGGMELDSEDRDQGHRPLRLRP